MTQEKVSPLRERMMEDMRIRGMGDKSQKAHIRALKDFSAFLGRSPDTAEPDDLRAYQLHMADTGVTPSTFNARIVALRFFFSMTCDRDEMKKYMQFRTEPRKLPIVLSVEEVSADTSSTLRTMGNLRGSVRNCMYFFISSRSQVIEKKNLSATMRALNVDGVTPVSAMCN